MLALVERLLNKMLEHDFRTVLKISLRVIFCESTTEMKGNRNQYHSI